MKRHNVLMIDDDSESIERVHQYLDRDSFLFESSTDPFIGIEKAKELNPDIIILDIRMSLPGYEVCKRLHSHPTTSGIPIIIYSVQGDEDDAYIHSLNLGVCAVLSKGNLSRLVAAIDRFIKKDNDQNLRVTVFSRQGHELKIQGTADRVWVDGNEKFLRPKTRSVLGFLATRPGILVSSEDLVKVAYSDEDVFHRGPEDIHRLMHDLRTEIEPDPQHPLFIDSKKRVGYRVITDESDLR